MKAALCTSYGGPDVIQIRDVPTPIPGPHEILVRVRAASVSSADWRIRSMSMPLGFGALGRLAFGVRRPRRPILGSEIAGEVAAVGAGVLRFHVGDRVCAFTGARLGGHAEAICLDEKGPVIHVPWNLGHVHAAALAFGGATMLDFFRRARLAKGERVLVNGASGAVGTAAVQLARHAGARVTGVCRRANAERVMSLGAEAVIDYESEDFARAGRSWDVIVDTVGNAGFGRCRPVLARGGRLLLLVASLPALVSAPLRGVGSGRRVIAGPAAEKVEYLESLRTLSETGHFAPVIDRTFPFEEIRAAHAYVATGRKRGNVVVVMNGEVGLPPGR